MELSTLLKTHNDSIWLLLVSLRAVQTLLYMLLTQIGMQQAHCGDKFVMQICRKDNLAMCCAAVRWMKGAGTRPCLDQEVPLNEYLFELMLCESVLCLTNLIF